jgi:hypothetical protein
MDPVEKFRQIKIHHHLISGLKMLLCLGDRGVGEISAFGTRGRKER